MVAQCRWYGAHNKFGVRSYASAQPTVIIGRALGPLENRVPAKSGRSLPKISLQTQVKILKSTVVGEPREGRDKHKHDEIAIATDNAKTECLFLLLPSLKASFIIIINILILPYTLALATKPRVLATFISIDFDNPRTNRYSEHFFKK